jgi:hypothetical protein
MADNRNEHMVCYGDIISITQNTIENYFLQGDGFTDQDLYMKDIKDQSNSKRF